MEQKLYELIEQVRTCMVETAAKKQNLLDYEVIELSELLDSLIYTSQLLKQNKTNKILYDGRRVLSKAMRQLENKRIGRAVRVVSLITFVESGRTSRTRTKRMMRHKDYAHPVKRRIRRRRAGSLFGQSYRHSIGGSMPSAEPIVARSSRS